MTSRFDKIIEQQEWIEPVAETVQRAVADAFDAAGKPVEDALHGKWLGHPLHAAITDVPIGAWTAANVLDAIHLITGNRRMGECADTAVGIGIAGATTAALAGLADWRWVYGLPRRVGLIHALSNTIALTLNVASLGLRLTGRRPAGVACSAMGFAAVMAGGWLGGKLSYSYGIGVDHTAFQSGPDEFVPVLDESALPEGQLRRANAHDRPILLYRQGRRISAIAETCAHEGGPLAEGRVVDGAVVCPWHGSTYCLDDGRVLRGPAVYDQPAFDVRVRNGKIEVRLASSPESPEREPLPATISRAEPIGRPAEAPGIRPSDGPAAPSFESQHETRESAG